MTGFPYQLLEHTAPALGLIVLGTDETLEQDVRQELADAPVRLHFSRIPFSAELTPDTIAVMEDNLTAAASLLPRAVAFDVVGYACTSATAQIGADGVAKRVQAGARARTVTDPLSAAISMAKTRGVTRLGIVSPYTDPVAAPLIAAFKRAEFEVPEVLSFGEELEANVARIDPVSIADAARALASRGGLDGMFLSCTNLQTLPIRAGLEDELGMPVISSNHALIWHMLKLANIHSG